MFQKLLTKSALRVILTLAVGLAIGLKFPEGEQILCTVAQVLDITVEQCQ